MKEWRPQVIWGMTILGGIAVYALYLGVENAVLGSVAGVVYAVKKLSEDGNSLNP